MVLFPSFTACCGFCGKKSSSHSLKCLFPSSRNTLCTIFREKENNPTAELFSHVLDIPLNQFQNRHKYCNACIRSVTHVHEIRIYLNSTPSYTTSTPKVTRVKRMAKDSPLLKSQTRKSKKKIILEDLTGGSLTSTDDHSYSQGSTSTEQMRKSFGESVFDLPEEESHIHIKIDAICDKLCRQTDRSVLRQKLDLTTLEDKDIIGTILKEFKDHLPNVFGMLKAMAIPIHSLEFKPSVMSTLAFIYSMLMFCRNNKLSYLQKLMTCLVVHYNGGNAMLATLHRSSLSLAAGSKIQFLDHMAKLNMEAVVKSLKSGVEGKLTVDNIDGMMKPSEVRKGEKKALDYHYCASTYLPDRFVMKCF